jgi:hypothetical protein
LIDEKRRNHGFLSSVVRVSHNHDAEPVFVNV